MKVFVFAFATMFIIGASLTIALGQETDSLPVSVLPDLIVTGTKSTTDPVQGFYRNEGSSSTEEFLKKLSGVSLIRRGAYGEDPIIRGLGNGQINLTVDGMRMFSACTDRMDPVTSYLDATNLSSVDGITDITASAFGSTFGGSINLILQKPQVAKERLTGFGGLQFGSSARGIATYGVMNASGKTSGYRFGVTHRKAGNYRSGRGGEVSYSQFEKLQISTAGKWATGSYDTLTAEMILDDGWNIGFPALPMDVGSARARIFAVTFERVDPWWILHSLKVKGYHNRIRHTMDDSARPDVVMPMDMPGSSYTSGIFAEGDVHIFHEHGTTMKLEYFSNTSSADMIMYPAEGNPMYTQTAPQTTTHTAGYFLQQRVNLTGTNKLMLTLRADVVSQFLRDGPGRRQWEVMAAEIAPRTIEVVSSMGISYSTKPTVSTLVNIQASYGERAPGNNERYGYFLFNRFDGFDYIGNPFLGKESALNAEGTLRWFLKNVELNITPYTKRINNFIFSGIQNQLSTMTPGAQGVKQYTNIDYATVNGADMVILLQPFRTLQWINTLKYTRGTTSDGEPLPLMPPLRVSSSINYTHQRFEFQADVEHASRQRRVSKTFGEDVTPSFCVLGVRAGWKRNDKLTINAGVDNLFDRKYHAHLDWGNIPRPGRNIYIDVRIRY
jgi:iron complex outermembrane recepter protein